MLRHDYTNYDGVVINSRTDRLYREILDAIARDFPWLATQCEREKAPHPGRLNPGVQARRYSHRDAVDKQRAARQVVKNLSVGDKVMVKWRGMREAEVVEIRRTRIKLAFDHNGSRHVIDRSADEIEAVPR